MAVSSGREELLSVLGGSLIAEELKGDLAAARATADEALAAARVSGDGSAIAIAALDAGLVATLQGDVGWAIERLDEALALGLGDADAALAVALRRLAFELRFAMVPGGGGTVSTELTRRVASAGIPPSQRTDSSEARLIYDVLVAFPSSRTILDVWRWTIDEASGAALEELLGQLPPRDASLPRSWWGFVELAGADLCRRAEQLDLARERLAVALEHYRAADDVAGEGLCHLAEGDWACAPLSTPSAWDLVITESSGGGSMLLRSLELAELGLLGAPPPAAEAAYERAAACFSAAGAPRGVATVDLRRAYLGIVGGVPDQAREYAARARAGFDGAGDRLGAQLARAHHALAALWGGDRTEDASTAVSIGAWGRGEASFSFALGIGLMFTRAGRHARMRTGDQERALACYRLAQALFAELGAAANAAESLVDQGEVRGAIGDWAGASLANDEALARLDAVIREQPDDARLLALRRGLILIQQERLVIGLRDPEALNRVRSQLDAQRAQLLPFKVDEPLDEVTVMLAGLEEQITQIAVLEPLYRALRHRDDFRESFILAERDRALAAARQAGDRGDYLEAVVHLTLGDRAAARDPYFRHLARMDAAGPEALVPGNLGLPLPAELVEQARRYALIEQAAFLVELHEWPAARQRFDALAELAGTDSWEQEQRPWTALDAVAQAYEGTGDVTTARQLYERAMETLERRRERLTAGELRVTQNATARPFVDATRAMLRAAEQTASDPERGDLHARAFTAAERGRARVLLDMMSASAALARAAPEESATVRRWRELSARLAARRATLVAARAEAAEAARKGRIAAAAVAAAAIADLECMLGDDEDALDEAETTLSRDQPKWHKIVAPASQVLALEEVADRIPPDTVLISYLFGDDQILGWAIGRDGLLRAPHGAQPATWALRSKIANFTSRVGGGGEEWDVHAPALSEELLVPFGPELERYGNVILVPWGQAHQLPFSALPWNGGPLLESHAVSVLPSSAALGPLESDATASLGRCSRSEIRRGWSTSCSASHARGSSKSFRGLVPRRRSPRRSGQEARRGPARGRPRRSCGSGSPAFRWCISRATPSSSPSRCRPSSCWPVAMGSRFNILGLDLSDARFVVLSACETARGMVTDGDEVLGLSWGMLATGARAAIASLWQVDARSAPLLMAALYRRLLAGDSPASALRAAQLHVRHLDAAAAMSEREALSTAAEADRQPAPPEPASEPDYAHPRHWAAHVCIGI